MNSNEFECAVRESGLDAESRALLRYFATVKNWKDNGSVWVSTRTTVRETGLSQSTVDRRKVYLRELGWLVDTGERVGNGAIKYDLAIGTSITETEVTSVRETDVSDAADNNLCHTDRPTSVSETRTSVTQTRTSVWETDKYEGIGKEQVIEEVIESPVPDGPVDEDSSNNEIKKGRESKLFNIKVVGGGPLPLTREQIREKAIYKTEAELRQRRERILKGA